MYLHTERLTFKHFAKRMLWITLIYFAALVCLAAIHLTV
jgi:hypothetical protein